MATKEQISDWLSDKNDDNLKKIITQYEPFVKGVVSKICRNYGCYDNYNDFMQEAHIPLLKTYWDYDKSRGADFTTILKIRIEGYIQQMYNQNYRLVSIPKNAFKEKSVDNVSILLNDYYEISNPEVQNLYYNHDTECKANDIRDILKSILSPRQFLIISKHSGFFGQQKQSATKIAEYFGLSRKTMERDIIKIKDIIAQNKNKFKGEI